jgi:predicted RND superfamily exporter protein
MLKRFLNITMIVLLCITALLVFECRNIRFDYNFEHFFPVESDDAAYYYEFRDRFESDNAFFLIGLQHPKSIFNPAFLQSAEALRKDLKALPNVLTVTSITNIKTPIISSFGLVEVPVIDLEHPENLSSDSSRIFSTPVYQGSLVSADGKNLALYIRHVDNLSKPAADSLLRSIEKRLKLFPGKTHITGKLLSENTYLGKTQQELLLFMSIAFLLVTFFLWLTFRNFWGVVVPLSVVVLSIIWTIGIMAATGKSIDIMIILMPCILFVVGMSDVIHITSQFYEKIEAGFERVDAIRLALQEVGFATFLTCVSTAVAFLTLNTTSIQPIRDFGTYTAIGVVVAYIFSITLLPFILLRVKNPDQFRVHASQMRWDRFLRRLLRAIFKKPALIIAGAVVVLIISIVGIGRIEVNNSVLDDLDENDPIKIDFQYFDNSFSGVRGFEMAVSPAGNSTSLLHWNAIQEMQMLEQYLETKYQVGAIVSPLNLIKGFNQAVHEGDPAWYRIPKSEPQLDSLTKAMKPFLGKKEIRLLLTRDGQSGRITGRIKDKGSKAVGIKNVKLEDFLKKSAFQHIQVRVTGSSDLIDKSNSYLTENMLQGLSLDIAVLMLIIGIIFRSWRMMLLSVLPNILPLCMIAGLMGWAGIEMKVTISIIFSIAFGIAVDDTLHLLSRLKVELAKGSSLPMALRVTYLSTGKAMILTAMVIAAGFGTLMLSDFKSTFYVGMMISVTLIFALIAELVLMPVLLIALYGKKKTTRIQVSDELEENSSKGI